MRPSVDQWAMELARATAKRSTCLRRAVGCVLLDAHNRVVATGYNGVSMKSPHCNEELPEYENLPLWAWVNDYEFKRIRAAPILMGAIKQFREWSQVALSRYTTGVPTEVLKDLWNQARRPKNLSIYPNSCADVEAPAGTPNGCQAIHAEQNALLQCKDVWALRACYTTSSPCLTCVKLLLNTSAERVVFDEPYPHPEAKVLWERAGRVWVQYG